MPSDQIKYLCPRCGKNRKMPSWSASRTSPLASLCAECENIRKRLLGEKNKNIRNFLENMRRM